MSIADAGRSKARFYGVIENTPQSILTVLKAINPEGEVLGVCYEAGPCGYGLYRQLSGMGHDCEVVAPSLIPRRGSSRVKTDRRDKSDKPCGDATYSVVRQVFINGEIDDPGYADFYVDPDTGYVQQILSFHAKVTIEGETIPEWTETALFEYNVAVQWPDSSS